MSTPKELAWRNSADLDLSAPEDRAEARLRVHTAFEHLAALCAGHQQFTMRVPASFTMDSDLILAEALMAADKALDLLDKGDA